MLTIYNNNLVVATELNRLTLTIREASLCRMRHLEFSQLLHLKLPTFPKLSNLSMQ